MGKLTDSLNAIKEAEAAARFTRVAAEMASQFGCTIEEATRSMQSAALALRSVTVQPTDIQPTEITITMDEYGLLQRVAAMAGQMLAPIRQAGLNETEYARYTALRDALVALQIYDSKTAWAAKPLNPQEVEADLLDLLTDLGKPPTTPGAP